MPRKKRKDIRVLRIPVKKWLHGKRDAAQLGGSQLLRPSDGKMCCLGIYLHACGVPKKTLSGITVPFRISGKVPRQARWLLEPLGFGFVDDSDAATAAMRFNDGRGGPIRRGVTRVFAEQGIKVKFV